MIEIADPLILALPSKGRLKEQVEAWLVDCGLTLRMAGGVRGYSATLDGFPEIQVRLASASDIAAGLLAGETHLGITGEDLLREAGDTMDDRVMLLMALGFGRADLVVAAPKSWIDVESMVDVDDVAQLYLARTGRRLRVATKYLLQTRRFFARHGIADYRLAESGGATEGAPAAGTAELVVDITSSGATLAANGLKVLDDGLILSSQAHVAAGLTATWDARRLDVCRRLLSIVAARGRGRSIASLAWPPRFDSLAGEVVIPFVVTGDMVGAGGVLVSAKDQFAATDALSRAGVGPVSVSQPTFVFEATNPAVDRLAARVGKRT